MTKFTDLFKQMFLQKRRYAHLVLLVQIFAVIFIFLLEMITNNPGVINFISLSDRSNTTFWDIILSLGILSTGIGDMVFLALLCWQNEKINLSQTWRLIPVSSVKFWWINIFSSLVECAYIFVIQVALGIIVFIFDYMSHGMNFFYMAQKYWGINEWSDLTKIIEMLLYLVGFCLIVFCFVSFADFLTRTITDQLPGKNTTMVKVLVMMILVIIAVTIAFRINDQITAIYIRHLMRMSNDYAFDTLPISISEFFAGASILGVANSYLIQKFVEPKVK